MKITKNQLKKIIKEELSAVLGEDDGFGSLRQSIPDEIHSAVEGAFAESKEMYGEYDPYSIAGELGGEDEAMFGKIANMIENFQGDDVSQLKLGVATVLDKGGYRPPAYLGGT